MESKKLAKKISEILENHKGEDVVVLDVIGKSDIADYFVIATGRSTTHTRSLIEKVEEETEKDGISPIREEGAREGRWAVLDYGDVIVHIFNDETRFLYHLEKLWGKAEKEEE